MVQQRIVALAGGVGGAKLAHGLQMTLPDPTTLSVIINTADDFELYGLHISPDIDTVTYTLAGIANPVFGWGIQDDTQHALSMITQYGEDPWFLLGDRDFATHILRTQRLRQGTALTQITRDMSSALGVSAALIPMCDQPVATLIDTPDGRLDFQQYFVAHRHADTVTGVVFAGIEHASPSPAALAALADADAIIFCPSNPIVSIGPILAIPGMRNAINTAVCPKVVVSPIVGGQALKGPAAAMLQSLGHDVSSVGVARLYAGLVDGMVIDHADAALAPTIEAEGMRVLVTNSVMQNDADRATLARATLDFAQQIAAERVSD